MTASVKSEASGHRPAYETVSVQIAALIDSAGLKAGDRLPTEQELGKHLGVSRTVVREAVKALVATGRVHARKGSGLYVADTMSPPPAFTLDPSVLVDPTLGNSIYEYRFALEVPAVRLAAERITPRELRTVQEALVLGQKGAESGRREDFHQGDMLFHQAIAEASGNPFISSSIVTVTRAQDWIFRLAAGRTPEKLMTTIAQHVAIYDAIKDGNPDAAARAMQSHLEWALVTYQQEVRRRLLGDEGSR